MMLLTQSFGDNPHRTILSIPTPQASVSVSRFILLLSSSYLH
jgi:hypothetical protein